MPPRDQLLLERSAPGDLARNMAGGDGRDSIELLYLGDRSVRIARLYRRQGAGDRVFDEQQAVVGRVAYIAYRQQ